MSESTTGVMHAIERSTATPTSVGGGGQRGGVEVRGQQGEEPLLPEDIGRDTASMLVEEIVKVLSM